jgi:hypothetical protein
MTKRNLLIPVLALLITISSAGGGCGAVSGCLSASEVREKVNQTAAGFESSQEEVEAKQNEIAEIREREC